MDLVLAGVVGEPHLADPLDAEGVQEPVDALGDEVGVVDGERPAKVVGPDLLEVRPALLHGVGQVVHLRARRLGVEILEEEPRAGSLGVRGQPGEPLEGRGLPRLDRAAEVVAGVDHDPLAAEPRGEVDVGAQVGVDALGDAGGELRDVDARQRVQAEVNAVPRARLPQGAHALGLPRIKPVEPIGVEVDMAEPVAHRPLEGVLEPGGAGVEPDPVAQAPAIRPRHAPSRLTMIHSNRSQPAPCPNETPREDQGMNIASILASKGREVVTIGPRQTVRQALRVLVAHNIGALVVVGEADRPVGIVSERDIVREAARNERVFTRTVAAIMTKDVVIGQPQDDLSSVGHTMTERRIRHLPVMDGGRLVGIVSIGDVVKAQRDRYQGEVETLQTQLLDDRA